MSLNSHIIRFYIVGSLLLNGSILSVAQVSGCTDPLAYNYNSQATENDGSCLYRDTSVTPTLTVTLSDSLAETSGLIHWNDFLWTHNDNNDTRLYRLDTLTGGINESYQLGTNDNTDWEDIAQDKDYIYIGDFGNNASGNRTDLHILRIDKSTLNAGEPVIDTLFFSYSDQIDFQPADANNTDYDCEAMLVIEDSIFLFTKQWISGQTAVYSFPKTPGTHTADLRDHFNVQGLITGAACHPSTGVVALCGYNVLLPPFIYLLFDFEGTRFFSGNVRRIDIPPSFLQIEGITTFDGVKYYLTNESFTWFPTILQQLHVIELGPYLYPDPDTNTSWIPLRNDPRDLIVYPNPANGSATIYSDASLTGSRYIILDQNGKQVMTGKLEDGNTTIGIDPLTNGLYVIMAGEHSRETFKIVKQ